MSSAGPPGLPGRTRRTPTWRPAVTTPAHPGRMLFVNIPVADLERSKVFFAKLGFSFNPNFTDETAACMLVGEQASVMLLSHKKFAEVEEAARAHEAVV